MRIGSLFSGIGGLELGLERAGVGHTVWQVEREPYCHTILARHWPHAERFSDVRGVGSHNLSPVDLVCGGFPCQDVSSAGPRTGLAGARSGLWIEFSRIIRELEPAWVVVENVASGMRRWVDPVRAELDALAYDSLPFQLEARYVGLSNRRARIFIVAHRRCNGRGELGPQDDIGEAWQQDETGHQLDRCYAPVVPRSGPGTAGSLEPGVLPGDPGIPRRVAKQMIRVLGNTCVPQCAEVAGRVVLIMARRMQESRA